MKQSDQQGPLERGGSLPPASEPSWSEEDSAWSAGTACGGLARSGSAVLKVGTKVIPVPLGSAALLLMGPPAEAAPQVAVLAEDFGVWRVRAGAAKAVQGAPSDPAAALQLHSLGVAGLNCCLQDEEDQRHCVEGIGRQEWQSASPSYDALACREEVSTAVASCTSSGESSHSGLFGVQRGHALPHARPGPSRLGHPAPHGSQADALGRSHVQEAEVSSPCPLSDLLDIVRWGLSLCCAGPVAACGGLTACALRSNIAETEKQLGINPAYLEQHDHRCQPKLWLDSTMRTTAVSWLVEVAAEYRFHADTLFLAISLLDRFLSYTKVCLLHPHSSGGALERSVCSAGQGLTRSGLQSVPRNTLQLVGVACMLLAAKYEEVRLCSALWSSLAAAGCYVTCGPGMEPALVCLSSTARLAETTSRRSATLQWPTSPALQTSASRCALPARALNSCRKPVSRSLRSWCLQKQDLVLMESVVLSTLSFRMNLPTAFTFLSLYGQILRVPPAVRSEACYLAVCLPEPGQPSAERSLWQHTGTQ